jgi:hypothetical protein
MPIIANTTSGNTFSAIRAQLNSVTKRINQFAINESTLYANTITANSTLRVSGGLLANGSLGTANKFLKTNGTSVYWGEGTAVVLTKKNVSALVEADQVVTNVQTFAYANTVVDNSLLANYAPKNNPQFTGTVDVSQANIKSQTLTDGATVNWNAALGTLATVTLGGNRTIANPSNLKVGTYMLVIKQDATGSRTATWGTVYKFPVGVAPTLTTTANAIDIISFYSDGTNMFGVFAPDLR